MRAEVIRVLCLAELERIGGRRAEEDLESLSALCWHMGREGPHPVLEFSSYVCRRRKRIVKRPTLGEDTLKGKNQRPCGIRLKDTGEVLQ